jgi:hypothetical protein
MFDDNEMEPEYTGAKKISFAKVVNNNPGNQQNQNNTNQTNKNANTNANNNNNKINNSSKREDKVNYFKNIVSEYIKDKELNM